MRSLQAFETHASQKAVPLNPQPSSPYTFRLAESMLNAELLDDKANAWSAIASALQEDYAAYDYREAVTWTEEERRKLAASFCAPSTSNARLEGAVERALYDTISHAVLPTRWTMQRDSAGGFFFCDKYTGSSMRAYPLEDVLRQLATVLRTGLGLASGYRENFFETILERWACELDGKISQWHAVQGQGVGRPYYYNEVSLETTWDHPYCVVLPEFHMKLKSLERLMEQGYLETICKGKPSMSSTTERAVKDTADKESLGHRPLAISAPVQMEFRGITSTAGPTNKPAAEAAPGLGMEGSRSLPALTLTQAGTSRPSSGGSRPASKECQLLSASMDLVLSGSMASTTVLWTPVAKNDSEQHFMSDSLGDKGSLTFSKSSISASFQSSTFQEEKWKLLERNEMFNRAKFKLSAGIQDLKVSRKKLELQLAIAYSRPKSAPQMQTMPLLQRSSSHLQGTARAANVEIAVSRDLASQAPTEVAPASNSPNRHVPVKSLTRGSSSSGVSFPPVEKAGAAFSSQKTNGSAWIKEWKDNSQETSQESLALETIDIVQRLRAKLYGRQLICIIGSAPVKTESVVILRALAKELASRLEHKAVFVTAGQPGLPKAFAEELIAEAGSKVKLWHVLPVGEECCYEDSAKHEVRAGADAAQHREIFGQLGDMYIIAEGGPEDASIARAAHTRGAGIVPLAATGGASSGLYGFPSAALDCPHWALAHKEAWGQIANSHSRVGASVLASACADVVESWLASVLAGPIKRPRSHQSLRAAQLSSSGPSTGNGGSSFTSIAHSGTILSVEKGDVDSDCNVQRARNYRNSMEALLKKVTALEPRVKAW